jgi:ubiquinone/menaquinone biosynthesis C-methylase UbiE
MLTQIAHLDYLWIRLLPRARRLEVAQNIQSEIDWNEYAENYDSLLELMPYRHMLSEVAGAIDLSRASSALDAGCGTGNLLTRLMPCGIPKLVGMDSSAEMLARAEKKCAGVQLIRAELNDPFQFSNETFGAVACVNALYAVEDPELTLLEFARILTANGMLAIVTPKQGYENGLILKAHCESPKSDIYWRDMHASPEKEEALMREALSDEVAFRKMRAVADVNRRISQNAKFHFFTTPELWSLVENTGFCIVDYRETYARQSHLLIARRT